MNTTLKILTAAAALLTAIAAPAAAQVVDNADEATKLALTDIGHEAVACSMYYNFIALLGKRDWPQKDNSPAERAAELTMGIGLTLLPQDVATALQKLTASEISQMLAGDTGRLPILAAKYADLCKALIEQPKGRMDYWLNVERAGIASAKK